MAFAVPPKYIIEPIYDSTTMYEWVHIYNTKKGMLTYNTQHSFLYCSHTPWQDTIGILCQCVV